MHPRKYFTLNFFINEIFSVKKFPTYGINFHCTVSKQDFCNHILADHLATYWYFHSCHAFNNTASYMDVKYNSLLEVATNALPCIIPN